MLLPAVKMRFGQNGGQTINSQKGQKVDKLITLRHRYIYIYIIQGVSLKMNPKCDERGSFFFFEHLMLSAVL